MVLSIFEHFSSNLASENYIVFDHFGSRLGSGIWGLGLIDWGLGSGDDRFLDWGLGVVLIDWCW